MKILVTGLDSAGRTCVVQSTTVEAAGDTMGGEQIFQVSHIPPTITAPKSTDGFIPAASWTNDMPPPPGQVTWMAVQFPPDGSFDRHQTPTLDFDSILDGSLDLTLDDGVHHLDVGDCVVIAGIDHAWRAGAEGCTMAVLMLGAVNRD